MIAIVILGIGLLIVAGMFPVAWMKARDQVEFTNLANAVTSAEIVLKAKLRVAKYSAEREAATGQIADWFDPSSFLGDLGVYLDGSGAPGTDDRVHPINVYNMLTDPGGYPSSPPLGEPPIVDDLFVPEHLHRIDHLAPPSLGSLETRVLPTGQVRFEERVIPPMPLWPRALEPSFNPDAPANADIVAHWRSLLRTRRYCWAVLAKMNNGYPTTPYPGCLPGHVTYRSCEDQDANGELDPNRGSWDDARIFTMYYVLLRRGQETFRFPQQAFEDPGADWPPVIPNGTVAQPAALPPSRDTVFPSPWRVQVFVPNPSPPSPNPTGVPSEVEVNTANVPTGRLVTDLLPRGAYMIDELSGNVYKVVRRTLTNNGNSAILTLDQEITQAEITPVNVAYEEPRDNLRAVWVFPPPVEPTRMTDSSYPDGLPIFAGSQPVVGIEVRPMVVAP